MSINLYDIMLLILAGVEIKTDLRNPDSDIYILNTFFYYIFVLPDGLHMFN